MSEEFAIIKTHPLLVEYVDGLQKANVDALSFYPRQVFERESIKGRLYLGLLNGEPCGYIYSGSRASNTVKCHQVCIQYDARRRLYGARLVVALEQDALVDKCTAISLRCGFDLEANDFWKSLGYRCIGWEKGGIRRQRTINIWRKQIGAELFEDIHVEPAVGKQDATLWRKHKQTGILTQFNRGRSLRQYRALILSGADTLVGKDAL